MSKKNEKVKLSQKFNKLKWSVLSTPFFLMLMKARVYAATINTAEIETATENQLIKLTNCSIQDINYLLTNKLIIKDKETGLIYHKLRGLDIKFMVALDVICKYQKDLQIYEKEKFPVIINFIVENISYDIIVARLIEQKRIFEMLDEVSSSDRIILVIENKEMYNIEDIKTNRECLICEYPLKIIGKIN